MANRAKRVAILSDTQTHMMPALAHEMARRDHDLVLGDAKDGLADELRALGATVLIERFLSHETISWAFDGVTGSGNVSMPSVMPSKL